MADLREYYYGESQAPHEALGRAARRLSQDGAIYLGGGVGIEKQTGKSSGDTYHLTLATGGQKAEKFTGPLSAVMRGFATAGASSAADTPGGASKVTDPAAAARLRELNDAERQTQRDIERYTSKLKAKVPQASGSPFAPTAAEDDRWEARRLAELKAELTQIRSEKATLISTGKVEEVEQVRPGTNFTKIPPQNVKKLSSIIDHYRGMAHPFSACVRDQVKHGLSEDHAKRRCAVVKDLGEGTTKWRKGGGHSKAEESVVLDYMERACEQIAAVDGQLGAGAAVELAERAGATGDESLDALGEMAFDALGTLFLVGHPLGVCWQQVREGFVEGDHPRDFLGQFKAKVGALKKGETAHAPGGITVKRTDTGFEVKGGAGLGHYKAQDGMMKTGKAAADEKLPAPNQAAMLATMRSLRSRDSKSLGGDRHYTDLTDYEQTHGKPDGSKPRSTSNAGSAAGRSAPTGGKDPYIDMGVYDRADDRGKKQMIELSARRILKNEHEMKGASGATGQATTYSGSQVSAARAEAKRRIVAHRDASGKNGPSEKPQHGGRGQPSTGVRSRGGGSGSGGPVNGRSERSQAQTDKSASAKGRQDREDRYSEFERRRAERTRSAAAQRERLAKGGSAPTRSERPASGVPPEPKPGTPEYERALERTRKRNVERYGKADAHGTPSRSRSLSRPDSNPPKPSAPSTGDEKSVTVNGVELKKGFKFTDGREVQGIDEKGRVVIFDPTAHTVIAGNRNRAASVERLKPTGAKLKAIVQHRTGKKVQESAAGGVMDALLEGVR